MGFYEIFLQPFSDYGFMRRALVVCLLMAVSCAPLGVFLVLRRMTLMAEVTSHAILPGAAIAFLISGLSLWQMTLGGLVAGVIVAFIAGIVTRVTTLKEDASFTAAYLASLALGVMIISMKGSAVDLLHILFGNILAVGTDSLLLVASVSSLSLLVMAIIYRPLIIECFDSNFLKTQGGGGVIYHQLFLFLIVLNLVASFQVIGTLMSVGIIVLPAIATRFWTKNIDVMMVLSVLFGVASSIVGLLISYHYNLPSSPAIVLVASVWYLISVFIGSTDGILKRFYPRKHFHLNNMVLLLVVFLPFSAQADGKIKVVASFSIIGDMVKQIAGDRVELSVLVKAGGDAHEYEPTPADVKRVSEADVIFINGLQFEGWMDRLIKSANYKGKIVVVSDGSKLIDGDPHAWQDLSNGKVYAANIRISLIALDIKNSEKYNRNYYLYEDNLTKLDLWLKENISKVPPEKRVVISTHDAFGYFARAYGVRFISALGISTHSQASAVDMARLVDNVRAKKVRVVFLENMTDSRLIKQLEKDAGAYIGGTLYSDSLSAEGGEAADYVSMFRHNAKLLIEAMQSKN